MVEDLQDSIKGSIYAPYCMSVLSAQVWAISTTFAGSPTAVPLQFYPKSVLSPLFKY